MEVAAISRNIASALRLNTDLAETIALAHDLGHSPFGHKGETVLNELMSGHGGFEHNHHSLRIVEELEQKYPNFSGLNLSWEVREGLAKHQTAFDRPGVNKGFTPKIPRSKRKSPISPTKSLITATTSTTAWIPDCCRKKIFAGRVRIWAHAARLVKKEHGDLPDECRRYFIIRTIIDMQIQDVVETSERLIRNAGVSIRRRRAALPRNRSCNTARNAAN